MINKLWSYRSGDIIVKKTQEYQKTAESSKNTEILYI